MTNPVITNNDNLQLPVFDPKFEDGKLSFTGAATWALGVIMAKALVAAGAVTPDGGNTGNGTVAALALAPGGPPLAGDWNLECKEAYAAATAGTVTPGSNTGDGTPGTCTPGELAKNGTYTLTCINDAVTGYAASGSEVFKVIDPDGNRLDDLTVAVAYSNDHFGLTIADGSADFIIGDSFTIAITAGAVPVHGGIFKLEDPNGELVADDLALPGLVAGNTLDVVAGGLSFTITDGTTNFAVGDKFALTITDLESVWRPWVEDALDGTGQALGVLPRAEVATGSGTRYRRVLVGGEVSYLKLSVQAGGTVPQKALDQLRNFTIHDIKGARVDILDNQ